MARSTPESRRKARIKAGFSVYYVIFFIFVYGPMFAMFTLSFQGPRGGVTFPMRGFSFYWWEKLTGPSAVGDLKASLVRSLILAVIVMIITALFSTMLAMAFRKRFRGSGALFYAVMAGLMVPGTLLSLGLATMLRQVGIPPNWWSSGLAVHVVWTLPFGFLEMMAVFKEITLPLILPGIVAAGLFGFTLSYDEFARTTLLSGASNTLPLDINASLTQRVQPTLFALGTASTLFSLLMIGLFIVIYTILYRRSH